MVFKSDFKQSNRDFHGLVLGREKLRKETSILKIIQRQRYFAASLKKLLGSAERQRLKQKTQTWVLDLNENKDSSDESESFDDAYRATVHRDTVFRDSVRPSVVEDKNKAGSDLGSGFVGINLQKLSADSEKVDQLGLQTQRTNYKSDAV